MLQNLLKIVSLSFTKEPETYRPVGVFTQDELFDEVYASDSLESDTFTPSKPEEKPQNDTDPKLRASDIYDYTGGKVKLYVKDGSGNFVEWKPEISGDSVLNNYTEEEIVQGLFSGTIKFTYTSTNEEIDLNTVRDILNGKIKPEDIKTSESGSEVSNDSDSSSVTSSPSSDQVRSSGELNNILSDLAKALGTTDSKWGLAPNNAPDEIIELTELYKNIGKMANSNNPEIAGIAEVILDLYDEMGVENWQNRPTGVSLLVSETEDFYIVTNAIISAVKGLEIDPPRDYSFSVKADPFEKYGITVDDLMSLDKDGDGSIVKELKDLLNNPEFTETVKFMLQRQENYRENSKLMADMAGDDSTITEDEIKAQFGKNRIADLFRLPDGSVDIELLIVLGAKKDKDGNFSISSGMGTAFTEGMVNSWIDTDRDGIVTSDEIAAFKQTEHYKKRLELYMRYGEL